MTTPYEGQTPATPATPVNPATPATPAPPPPGWYPNPTGPGQRYWDGYKWTDSYSNNVVEPEKKKGWGTGTIVVGYVFAFLGGLIGLIMGLVALSKPDKTTKMHGAIITVLSIIMSIIWIAASNAG